jgi:monoterpene epsilon-lactone hydrolase
VTGAGTGRPLRYEIRVRGAIGPTILEAFPTLSMRPAGTETLLSGRLLDQAALYGVIHQLEALGLELLEVRRLGTGRVA